MCWGYCPSYFGHTRLVGCLEGGTNANGGERIAISLNLSGIKQRDPVVPVDEMLAALMAGSLAPFDQKLAQCLARQGDIGAAPGGDDRRLIQRLHMELIQARMRILYLEDQLQNGPG